MERNELIVRFIRYLHRPKKPAVKVVTDCQSGACVAQWLLRPWLAYQQNSWACRSCSGVFCGMLRFLLVHDSALLGFRIYSLRIVCQLGCPKGFATMYRQWKRSFAVLRMTVQQQSISSRCSGSLERGLCYIPAVDLHCRALRHVGSACECEPLSGSKGDKVVAPVCRNYIFALCILQGHAYEECNYR